MSEVEIVEVRDDNETLVSQEIDDFERVNIDDPLSIMNYGSEAQKQVSALLKSTAQMTVKQKPAFLSEEMLAKVISFDEILKEQHQKEERKKSLLERCASFIHKKATGELSQETLSPASYQERYEEYVANLNLVSQSLDSIALDAQSDIKIRSEIVKKLKPITEYIDYLIKIGKQDLDAYKKQTYELIQTLDNPDDESLITLRTELASAFASQLNGLEKSVVLYKDAIFKYQLQQADSLTTAQTVEKFKQQQLPVLEAAASMTIFNSLESARQQSLLDLSEAANLAIARSALSTVEAVKQSAIVSSKSGFDMETINCVLTATKGAVKIIRAAKSAYDKKISEEREMLEEIEENFEHQEQGVLDVISVQNEALLDKQSEKGTDIITRRIGTK